MEGVISIIIRITPEQSERIREFVKLNCANCVENGFCLLLDDGNGQYCLQLINCSSICCKYFLEAVLPENQELQNEIIEYNNKEDTQNEKA